MDAEPETKLSEISTLWSAVCRAHAGRPEEVRVAQELLLRRYGKAAYRYLRGAVHDPDVADDLYQEFAATFLQGKLSQADPRQGRFRDYVKGVLSNLIALYHRKRRAGPLALAARPEDLEALPQPAADPDQPFLDGWRDELLARTWEALARLNVQTGQPFHLVLRLRADHPLFSSAQMAEQLSAALGK